MNPQEFSKASFKYELQIYQDTLQKNISVIKLIENAKKAGIKIAVATSSTYDRAKTILDML
jgi:beta-phosphoglucomutase-like phosphatase (HAD superfamily)